MPELPARLIQRIHDSRGKLSILEGHNVPFQIKRVYWIMDVPHGVQRGSHAHKELEQILICLKGNIVLHLNDGSNITSLYLNEESEGVYLGPGVWRSIDFSENATLLVLASMEHSELDYIRDLHEFNSWRAEHHE